MRFLLLLAATITSVLSQTQSDYYLREEIPLPKGEVMEISSIALMPDDRVAVATRRGDVWICTGAYGNDLSKVTWKKFAFGLHEPLGMYYQKDSLFLTQRPEFSRIRDSDADGTADVFETINSDWGISGDYHEYAFGTSPDKNGDVWITLCLTGSFHAKANWRGWVLRITPDGKMIPTCSGIRSPGGIGFNAEGDTFYTDNQGIWNGSSSLKWLKPGSFQGAPVGNGYHKLANLPEPPTPKDGSRILIERTEHPEFIPPAVIFPHGKVGQSPTGIQPDLSNGKFGPWKNQVYVGEQTHSQVQRVCLEKVNGIYQGAVFHMLEGFESGLIPIQLDQEKGILFAGGSNRGWASRGSKPFTFERVKWTGKTPFEMLTMKAEPDGFTITFTEPVDEASAANPGSYSMEAWTYILQSKYGSPEVDQATPIIKAVKLSADKKSVRLSIDGLVRGHVHHLKVNGLKSKSGQAIWHPDAYYTLNEIPAK
jgi:UDP-2,3-diacylglucosamine pyrophosphatase LpxH